MACGLVFGQVSAQTQAAPVPQITAEQPPVLPETAEPQAGAQTAEPQAAEPPAMPEQTDAAAAPQASDAPETAAAEDAQDDAEEQDDDAELAEQEPEAAEVSEEHLAEGQNDTQAAEAQTAAVQEPAPSAPQVQISPEKAPWYKTFYKDGGNYITIDPMFLIINTGLGVALGLDGTKTGLNEQLETKLNDIYVFSEMFLKTKGRAGVTDLNSSGFGFALQYERQVFGKFALMGRFSYSGLGMAMDFEDKYIDYDYSLGGEVCARPGPGGKCLESTDKFSIDLDYYNWALEIHSRYYPREDGSLFLDGVIGFGGAGLSVKKTHTEEESEFVVRTPDGGFAVERMGKTQEVINVPAKRGYMTIGPMFGWREKFGKGHGKFIWETSIGYLAGIGFSDPLADQTIDGNIELPHLLGEYNKDVDDSIRGLFGLVESLAIVGGPRFRMTIGWAF